MRHHSCCCLMMADKKPCRKEQTAYLYYLKRHLHVPRDGENVVPNASFEGWTKVTRVYARSNIVRTVDLLFGETCNRYTVKRSHLLAIH